MSSGGYLLPCPLPLRPPALPRLPPSRCRQRRRRTLSTWRSGTRALMVLNSLTQGRCGSNTTNRREQADLYGGTMYRMQQQLWDRLCCESQRHERRRGEAPPPIGVQALAKLLKMGPDETYLIGSKRKKHPPLIADLIAEPEDASTVDLLRALPEE